VKATNLATLHTLDFPDGTVPSGHAVPFHFYDTFMKHNGLYDKARAMLGSESFKKIVMHRSKNSRSSGNSSSPAACPAG